MIISKKKEKPLKYSEDLSLMYNVCMYVNIFSLKELARYPSPPPLRLASPERDTASAKERRKRESKLFPAVLLSIPNEAKLKKISVFQVTGLKI